MQCLFLCQWNREYQALVDMGILDFTFNVRAKCISDQWIPGEKLEPCNTYTRNFINHWFFPMMKNPSTFSHIIFALTYLFVIQTLPKLPFPLGVQVLKSRGFFTHAYWYWIGVGALVGFMFLLNIMFTISLSCLNREDLPSNSISWVSYTNSQF